MARRLDPAGSLRIVNVCPSYAPCIGGSERMLQAVSERLAARGHAVTVLTLDCASQRDFVSRTGAGLPPREMLNGVEVVRVSPGGGRLLEWWQWWLRRRGGWRTTTWLLGADHDYALSRPSGLGMIAPLLGAKAHVVGTVNWGFGASFWISHLLRLRRIPHVAVPVLHIERPWAHRKLFRRLLATSQAAIVLTEAERDFVRSRGAPLAVVAGGGVDPDQFRQRDGARIRARYGLGSRPVVGFVGRQDALKGVPTLVDAMRIVWTQAASTVLLLAGLAAHRDRVTSDRLAGLTEAERRRVLLLDDFADKDLPSIIDACDLLAQPSVEEAFGLVLLEAWMCERPVIGADIAATRQVIDHGQDGWLVTPFDAPDLAARILSLLGDPETRAAFGRRGRAKVLSRYTWDRITDIWETTYRNAVLDGSPHPALSPGGRG
jgi:glycosyltransferase involved in cell wall biosynthesis